MCWFKHVGSFFNNPTSTFQLFTTRETHVLTKDFTANSVSLKHHAWCSMKTCKKEHDTNQYYLNSQRNGVCAINNERTPTMFTETTKFKKLQPLNDHHAHSKMYDDQ